jgi:site-specific DNA-methyltransferase (adenine-specific)
MQYKKHRFNIYPEMQPEEFERLRGNLLANGYDSKHPIWLFEGEIIDGWNRYRACDALGIPPVVRNFEGSEIDAMQFAIRTNDRRDLSSSQRAAIAIEAEELVGVLKAEAARRQAEFKGNQYTSGVPELIPEVQTPRENKEVRAQLAQTFGTNPRYVSDAAKIKAENPEAFEAIKAGEKTITEVKKEEKIKQVQQKREESRKTIAEIVNIAVLESPNELQRIYLGDSRLISENYPNGIKLVLTDPPYGADFQSNRRVISDKADKIENDSNIKDALLLTENVISTIFPKMANDSAVLMWCNWQFEFEFRNLLESFGLIIKNSIVWVKKNHGTGDLYGAFAPKHERLIFAVKGRPTFTSYGRLPDVLDGSEFLNTEHPTPKPIDLLSKLICALTEESDIVVDPFNGCGSTAVAAIKNKRLFYGSEISEKYYNESIFNVKSIL